MTCMAKGQVKDDPFVSLKQESLLLLTFLFFPRSNKLYIEKVCSCAESGRSGERLGGL